MSIFTAWRQRKAINSLGLVPLPKILALDQAKRVIVFAPHPDDEILGCGGTLALLTQRGCAVKVIVITDGSGAGWLAPGAVELRRQETITALGVVGITDIEFMNEPDGSFRSSNVFEQKITHLLHQFKPDWIFAPSVLDYHRDHVAISQALHSSWIGGVSEARMFLYEIWCPVPATCIVDITTVLAQKKQAIEKYLIPLAQRNYLHASIGLASYRGLYIDGEQGERYAEAFVEMESGRETQWLFKKMLDFRIFLEKRLG
jgi:LmbE family N-acetylglucosaminyl deacetylase